MSQSSLIEDVGNWSEEECRQGFQVAVPKLIRSFDTSDSNSLGVLKLLLNNFTVFCDVQKLEQCLFAKLSDKICAVYERIFEEIRQLVQTAGQQVQQMQQQVSSLLQHAVVIIEGLDTSVKYIASQSDPVHIEYVHSLLPTTLHVIKTSYSHCKDSSTVYSQLLGVISEQLSHLFKKVHSLQMVLISLVDKLVVTSDSTEQDKEDLMQVILGLHTIGQVAATLDIKINVTIWKVVSRLAVQYKSILKDKCDYSTVIQSLCTHMMSSYDYLGQILPRQEQGFPGDEKAFSKHLKILGFQMKILLKFVDEFGQDLSGGCIQDIYKLLLHIQKFIPPSIEALHIPQNFTDEIQKQLTNGIEPLLTKLVTNRVFIKAITSIQQHKDVDAFYIPRCMTLLSITDLLHNQPLEVQTQWISPKLYPEDNPRWCLMKTMFEVTKLCYTELCMNLRVPGVACPGKQQGSVSLYDLICIKVCGLAASYPQQHFNIVEAVLLEAVLQPCVHTAMLAIDVWCFLARYGSAILCRDHCTFLTKLLLSDGLNPSPQCCHLLCLLRRMLKFLAPEHQVDYISTFPVSRYPALWCVVPLHTFSGETCQQVVDDIITSCATCIQEWTNKTQNEAEETLKLDHCFRYLVNALTNLFNNCFRCLVNAFTNPFIIEKHLNHQHYSMLLGKSMELLETLTAESVGQFSILQTVISNLLELLANFVATCMENIHILKVLNFLSSVLKQPTIDGSSQCIKLSSLTLLQSIGKKMLPPSTEQSEILHLLPKVFTTLLQDTNPIVRHSAVQTFAQFAEETPHESIVPECLSSNQEIQNEVVLYLNQLESGPVNTTIEPSQFDEQKQIHHSYSQTSPEELYSPTIWQSQEIDQQPLCKRMKIGEDNCMDDEQLKCELSKLEASVTRVQSMTQNRNTPPWAKQQIQHCHQMLSKLL